MYDVFLNCDWGTTRFRLRLVRTATAEMIAECSTQEGVGSLSRFPPQERAERFTGILQQHAADLLTASHLQGEPLPILISGMASSSMGWRELPYARTPFALSGSDLEFAHFTGTGPLAGCPIWLFSGVRSDRDVMRGEEMELIGIDAWLAQRGDHAESYQVILPGTHSKHIQVRQAMLISFQTFLTGELFQLLGRQSCLRHSQGDLTSRLPGDRDNRKHWQAAFLEGVELSREELSSSLFQVRTRQLLCGEPLIPSAGFLSGLLIGSELRTLQQGRSPAERIILAAAPELAAPYQLACEHLDLGGRMTTIAPGDVTRLSALGQARVLQRLLETGKFS